jgi:hypothetical protein
MIAADIACFQPGSIPNRNPQEPKPPALSFATAAMLIRADQTIVRYDLGTPAWCPLLI